VELEIRGAEFPTASIAIFRDESGCGIARRDCSDEDRTRLSRNNFGFHGALTEAAYAYAHYGRSRAPKHFGGILGGGSGNDLFGLPFLRRHRVGRSNRRVRNRSGQTPGARSLT